VVAAPDELAHHGDQPSRPAGRHHRSLTP
jgi:hypothetical protein